MNAHIITEEEMFEDTGFARRGDLRKWLDDEGVPYRIGRGGRICGVAVQEYALGSSADHFVARSTEWDPV